MTPTYLYPMTQVMNENRNLSAATAAQHEIIVAQRAEIVALRTALSNLLEMSPRKNCKCRACVSARAALGQKEE